MLRELEKELIKCTQKCDGINNNPKLGIIPRCLVLEKRKGKNNCIVVGLNPGKCGRREREYFLNTGIKHSSFSKYFFESNLNNKPYFKRTRDLITVLGFDGDILWTDLVKCEGLDKNGIPPIQTLRVCINRFLRKEVDIFKCSTIFALGNVAFDFCALSFPNHFIVGLPHPSGSYGVFIRLKNKVQLDTKYFTNNISRKKDASNNFRAIHLSKV